MDHKDVGKRWDENAEVWTRLARGGYDVYRDHVNTPAFLKMLPDISGLSGLDIGCGEGHNTRLVARRGARMTALDISGKFLAHAREKEKEQPLGIRYLCANAADLSFPDACFDFAIATMSLMDTPDHEKVIREIWRIIKPGGSFQFSITHPCFQTPRWKWIYDESGKKVAIECGDYFFPPEHEVEEWMHSAAPPEVERQFGKFRIPVFRRTLSSWVNLLVDAGFVLERMEEPYADEETIRRYPQLADTRTIAYFLIFRCSKPK
ncbi:MAG: SAM-dependent methyltransferase [Candidatus Abyssobacteria bacterium SURF_17]|uniref:SAM-dependent methyltransferase n=1 Tax=Candidatus Abyssobacteria bacterium SURF_17 TaxID=2093361 RepID=A0A419F6B8_9BACT|nr:MAG: SAM-dependent methyltransferase [Candidatus Abyssubacteria bacterium SURF_17]